MTQNTTVIIADDHPIFRTGLREIIDHSQGYQVIAEAHSGASALLAYQQTKPDIMVLDISMGEINGLEVAEKILSEDKQAKCIIMTMYNEPAFCKRALSLGVKGYLLKDDAVASIAVCMTEVMHGCTFVSPALGDISQYYEPEYEEVPDQVLTAKELLILNDIAQLKTNKEIANERYLSVRTIQNHRQNICSKLNLSGRQALLQYAVKWYEKNNV